MMTSDFKKTANKKYKNCSNKDAERNVVACLLEDPSLLKTYKISRFDFTDYVYQLIFVCIEQLYSSKAKVITRFEVEDFLKQYEEQYARFCKKQGPEILEQIEDLAILENMEFNFDKLKKFSMLRFFRGQGFDISEYYDETADLEERNRQITNLEKSTLMDISNNFKNKLLTVSEDFVLSETRDSKKAGVGGMAQKEKWKKETAWGLGYSSRYLTTALHGIRQRRFVVKSAGSGTGKTRTAIADICFAFCPKYYDKKNKKWCVNPNGTNNACLYIGTEMELIDEIEPILWAYIADVPQDHIEFNLYEPGEEERVDEAIRILEEEAHIYLAYLPDYDLNALESIIEKHKIEYGVNHVFFDYIHTTAELMAEYNGAIKGHMAVREDQVLANLSTKLKELTRKYNISLDTCTQTTGDLKDESNRDQTVVRGAKSIVDKTDAAMIATIPTPKELKMLEGLVKNRFGNVQPNLCYSLYKNRGGKLNHIKIWMYIDYGTMRTQDLFVTDYEYRELSGVPKMYINIVDDKRIASDKKVESIKIENETQEIEEQYNSEIITISESESKRLEYQEQFYSGENLEEKIIKDSSLVNENEEDSDEDDFKEW